MDGGLALREGWLCKGLALQGNVVQDRAGLASASPDVHTLQFYKRG